MAGETPGITSPSNPVVKRLRKLVRDRKYRETEGVFLIEGIAHVRQAIDHKAPLDSIVVAPELLTSDGAWEAIESQRAAGVPITTLAREAFEKITERDHPTGLAATVRMEHRPLADLVATESSVFVALLDVGNPGNLGSIVRTVDAVAGGAVIVVGRSTDPFHPSAVKASMGTIFSVPLLRVDEFDDLLAWCLMEQVSLVTTSARAPSLLWDSGIELPAVFLFGSEAHGLPQDIIERGNACVSLPMEGSASSLNLSVSVGVVLYEMKRRAR